MATLSGLFGRPVVLAVALMSGMATAGFAWGGFGQGGMAGGHGWGGHGRFGQRFARLRVEFMIDRMLRRVDATSAQREKVEAIVEKAFADHAAHRQKHAALRGEGLEILTADTIDRGRLEALRARHLAIAEEGSKHLVDVVADIAEVLTPEQRQTLAAHLRGMFE